MESPADGDGTGGATPGVECTSQPAPSAKRPKLNAGNILSFFAKAQTLTTGKDAGGKTPGGAGASGEGSTNEHAAGLLRDESEADEDDVSYLLLQL